MKDVFDNVAFDNIEKFVKEDLSKYGQDNPCPKSLTVVHGKYWRHYELGAIIGFVVYNRFDDYGFDKSKAPQEHFMISTIHEDDEYWFAPNTPMLVDAGWVKAINETWTRMNEWCNIHLRQGWERGADISNPNEYKREVKVPIVPEVVGWEDIPDNAVLGNGKYLFVE